jgi:hypothetical protein
LIVDHSSFFFSELFFPSSSRMALRLSWRWEMVQIDSSLSRTHNRRRCQL